MTTPDMTGGDAGSAVKPLRSWFAWALLGYVAVVLFLTFITWLIPADYTTFVGRSASAADAATTLVTIGFPLLAVLIVSQIQPALAITKLVSMIALAEYGFIILFGGLTWLIGLGSLFDDSRGTTALAYVVLGLLELGFAALAGYATLRVFTASGGRITLPTQAGPQHHHTTPPAAPYESGPVS
jgi:hypothetical protein